MNLPFFWIDVAAYTLTAVVAAALMLIVVGVGPRRAVNLSFGLLMLAISLWAGCSVVLRLALWMQSGTQQFWMEFSTVPFTLIGPFLLLFCTLYTQMEERWPYGVVAAGVLLASLLTVPLFQHQIVNNVRLTDNGIVTWDRSLVGTLVSIPLLISAVLALVPVWGAWRRMREPYLAIAIIILVVSGVLFSFISLPIPTLSLAITITISLMGYAILGRQLFNPLRELTENLEQQVAERTQALEENANELQRTLSRLRQHVTYLRTAAEVARDVAAIRDMDELLGQTASLIAERFDYYNVSIFLLDETAEALVLRTATSAGGQRMRERGYRQPVRLDNIVGSVAKTGQPRLVFDVGPGAVAFDNPDLPLTRSEIVVPLRVRNQTIGVLDVHSTQEAAFGEDDLVVLQVVADQLAVAIENTRLFAQQQASLRELDTLQRLYTGEQWERLLRERLTTTQYHYTAAGVKPGGRSWEAGEEEAITLGRVVTARDNGDVVLVAPITLHNQPIGTLAFRRPAEAADWTPQEMALVEAAVNQMALALENVRLLEEAQRRAARDRLISQAAARMRETLDLEGVLKTAANEIASALGLAALEVQLGTEPEQAQDS